MGVLVVQVEHDLGLLYASVIVAQTHLVEGLGSVEAQSVGGSELVSVLVLLSAPA